MSRGGPFEKRSSHWFDRDYSLKAGKLTSDGSVNTMKSLLPNGVTNGIHVNYSSEGFSF